MKCLIICLVFAGVCLSAGAQTENPRFSYSATVGVGMPLNAPQITPFTVQASAYYNLGIRWALGAGTGVSFYDGTALIPLFADVRFGLTRPRKFTPYLSCGVGYAFAPSKNANGGFLLSPAVGVQWKLRPRLKVHLAVGYEWQELERLKTYADPEFSYGFREQLNHQSLMIKAGVTF